MLAWTTGFLAGPALAGFALGADLGSALFVGLIVVCGIAGLATLRLARHLPPQANIIRA